MTEAAWESAAPKFKPTDSKSAQESNLSASPGLHIGSGIATQQACSWSISKRDRIGKRCAFQLSRRRGGCCAWGQRLFQPTLIAHLGATALVHLGEFGHLRAVFAVADIGPHLKLLCAVGGFIGSHKDGSRSMIGVDAQGVREVTHAMFAVSRPQYRLFR